MKEKDGVDYHDYKIIYGNTTFEVKDVIYDARNTHRTFIRKWRDRLTGHSEEIILSVPLSSVLIRQDAGVVVTVSDVPVASPQFIPPQTNVTALVNRTSVKQQTQDNFIPGLIAGGIAGALVAEVLD